MATIAVVTKENLQSFKERQDAANLKKFASIDENGIITEAQIPDPVPRAERAIKDDQGNPIATTYATKDELEENYATKEDLTQASGGIASVYDLGLVQIGENIVITNDGVISVNKESVVNALGYTPVDTENIRAMTEAEINAMFEEE